MRLRVEGMKKLGFFASFSIYEFLHVRNDSWKIFFGFNSGSILWSVFNCSTYREVIEKTAKQKNSQLLLNFQIFTRSVRFLQRVALNFPKKKPEKFLKFGDINSCLKFIEAKQTPWTYLHRYAVQSTINKATDAEIFLQGDNSWEEPEKLPLNFNSISLPLKTHIAHAIRRDPALTSFHPTVLISELWRCSVLIRFIKS